MGDRESEIARRRWEEKMAHNVHKDVMEIYMHSILGSCIDCLTQIRKKWDSIEIPCNDWIKEVRATIHRCGDELHKLRLVCPDCADLKEQYDSVHNDFRNEVLKLKKKNEEGIQTLREIASAEKRMKEAQEDMQIANEAPEEIAKVIDDPRRSKERTHVLALYDASSKALNLALSIKEDLHSRIATYKELLKYQSSREEELKMWKKELEASVTELDKLVEPSHKWKPSDSIVLTTNPGFVPRAESSLTKRRNPVQKKLVTYTCGKCGKRMPSDV